MLIIILCSHSLMSLLLLMYSAEHTDTAQFPYGCLLTKRTQHNTVVLHTGNHYSPKTLVIIVFYSFCKLINYAALKPMRVCAWEAHNINGHFNTSVQYFLLILLNNKIQIGHTFILLKSQSCFLVEPLELLLCFDLKTHCSTTVALWPWPADFQ